MKAGTLTHTLVTSDSNSAVYTIPSECLFAEIDISVCSLLGVETSCSITIGGDSNYLYKNYPVAGSDTLFSKAELCSPGDVIKVNPGADVSVRISGKIHYNTR